MAKGAKPDQGGYTGEQEGPRSEVRRVQYGVHFVRCEVQGASREMCVVQGGVCGCNVGPLWI